MILALALVPAVSGCEVITEASSPATLRLGYDTRDGDLEVWPPRGPRFEDTEAAGRVSAAVEAWRSPGGDRVHLASSGILWLGDVDGETLAVVAANVPGGAAAWLLQLSGNDTGFEIDRTAEYADPGYLVYSDVLPLHLPSGRRYLTSTRVERLTGPDGAEIKITDGLSDPVEVPECGATSVTASLRPTASLPEGNPAERLIDLGTGLPDGRYPLVRDESESGVAALVGLDTCSLAKRTGPFGSIPRRNAAGEVIDDLPLSWPLDRISARSLGEFTLRGSPARLDLIEWQTVDGGMSAVAIRPRGGPPVMSPADRGETLSRYIVRLDGQPHVVLVWRPDGEARLSIPAGTTPLVDRPGLVIVPKPAGKQTYTLHTPYQSHEREVTDRDVRVANGSDRPR